MANTALKGLVSQTQVSVNVCETRFGRVITPLVVDMLKQVKLRHCQRQYIVKISNVYRRQGLPFLSQQCFHIYKKLGEFFRSFSCRRSKREVNVWCFGAAARSGQLPKRYRIAWGNWSNFKFLVNFFNNLAKMWVENLLCIITIDKKNWIYFSIKQLNKIHRIWGSRSILLHEKLG